MSRASFWIGYCGGLTTQFVIFKLCGKIDWSWLWIFSPVWIPIVLLLAIAFTVALIKGIIGETKGISDEKDNNGHNS